MNRKEWFGLLLLLIISTLYHFSKPEDQVEKIETKKEIVIYVEGQYEQKLIFDHNPTIQDVFISLNVENIYGFENDIILDHEALFYIPYRKNLISINFATKEELMTLKGVGDKTADKIIEQRTKERFHTIEDLTKVNGIGEKTYLKLREYVCL